MDLKHVIGWLVTMALAVGIQFASKNGVEVKCPADSSAVSAPAVSGK